MTLGRDEIERNRGGGALPFHENNCISQKDESVSNGINHEKGMIQTKCC